MIKSKHWVQTFSGKKLDFLDPDPAVIDVVDIAVALSRQCRYNGNCSRFYSVAEHLLLIANELDTNGYHPSVVMAGLLHDAHEAYTGDIVSPFKSLFGDRIYEIENRVQRAINTALGVANPTKETEKIIKNYDMRALATEQRDLFDELPEQWPGLSNRKYRPFFTTILDISTISTNNICLLFIRKYNELKEGINER